jgi:hypothetical protein
LLNLLQRGLPLVGGAAFAQSVQQLPDSPQLGVQRLHFPFPAGGLSGLGVLLEEEFIERLPLLPLFIQ